MAFRAGTTSAFYITTAGGSLSNVSSWADSASSDLSASQLDVSAFGTQAQAFINGQTTGQISISGPLDAPMHTILTGLWASGSNSAFIYGPGGSVASQARIAGTVNVAGVTEQSSASGRSEYSATLQITGAVTVGTF
jgi:hypothetical protein